MKAKIKIKNGYWTFNGKPLSNCSFPEQQIVSLFIKNYVFNFDVPQKTKIKTDDIFFREHQYQFEFVKA
jgi:hypothetical protein